MCNLYTLKVDINGWATAHENFLGRPLPIAGGPEALSNRTWKTEIYPDYEAPILRNVAGGGQEVAFHRWGMPSSRQALFLAAGRRADKLRAKGREIDDAAFAEILRMEPDGGTTNIRNTVSEKTGAINKHWAPYLGVENRCIVPFTAFAEPDQVGGSRRNVWFAPTDGRPLSYFAGVYALGHQGVRKIKTGWETMDLYGFLTTSANAEVGAVHDKAMPVILTTAAEVETWLSAPWQEAKVLQRPLPAGALQVLT